MTHELNRGQTVTIMNGYQCYLKRMARVIPMEVLASQQYGFNMGIKLIRGAYMNEERALAQEKSLPSPVWDSIEETHLCYNRNMEHVLRGMNPSDQLFIASHNVETCELA